MSDEKNMTYLETVDGRIGVNIPLIESILADQREQAKRPDVPLLPMLLECHRIIAGFLDTWRPR